MRSRRPKKVWKPEDWTAASVWQRCLHLLGRRNYGGDELRQKLQHTYNVPEALAEAAVSKLYRLSLLQDDEYLGQLLRAYRRRGYGPHRMRRELVKKFLPEELIERALIAETEEEETLLRETAEKKWASMSLRDDKEKRLARLYRFLQGRGFSSQAISSVIQSLR